jgi:hypothetical protein
MAHIKLLFAILCCCLGGRFPARAEVPLAPPLRLAVSSVTVTEGNSGQPPFTAQVSLSGAYPTMTVTVKVTATPGTAELHRRRHAGYPPWRRRRGGAFPPG